MDGAICSLYKQCSAAAGQQLLTPSVGNIEMHRGYDAIAGLYFYNAR